jgi:hypothetical protein
MLYRRPMKKTLNADMIRSELQGGSAFFPNYQRNNSLTPAKQSAEPTPTAGQAVPLTPLQNEQRSRSFQPTERPPDEQTIRPDDVPTGRREFIRRGFEWYADQLRALKKLSLEEQMAGKPGNMSQMVRDALDDYLKKRAVEK